MAIVLPQVDRGYNKGEAWGAAMGNALKGGIESYKKEKEKQKMMQAFEQMGIDPAVANLPPEAQAAYFKQQFAAEKEETDLQKSQKLKNEEDILRSQEKRKIYGKLMQGGEGFPGMNQPQEMQENVSPEQTEDQMVDYLMGFEDELPSEKKISPKSEETKKKYPALIPEQKIAQAAASGNKPLADVWQKYNDNIRDQMRHDEQMNLKEKTTQTKEVRESFKENQDFINKVYDQYEDSLRKEADLDRMDQLNDSGELSDSATEWIKNPSNEEYNKLALDLLGGGSLQADYGSRVLASEFKVSQQRIPSLSQTQEGRRQISENIRTMLLPSKLKQERLQFYLDKQQRTGEPLPHNLRGQILKDIKPQLEEAYDKFKQRNGRYKVREGTIADDNALEKYYYLSDGDDKKAMKMMKEDGYDTR
jgi:hypothetical protein